MTMSHVLELTDDEREVLVFALKQFYLFDGWEILKSNPDAETVAELLVQLGEPDPRTEVEDE